MVEVLDLIRQDIEQKMGALELLAGNVVITGGASLMPGLDRVAAERFRLPVRIGKPVNVSGLVDVVASPAHATAVGLVRYGMSQGERAVTPMQREDGIGNVLAKIRNVLKDFF